jgi:hypothetical protein
VAEFPYTSGEKWEKGMPLPKTVPECGQGYEHRHSRIPLHN